MTLTPQQQKLANEYLQAVKDREQKARRAEATTMARNLMYQFHALETVTEALVKLKPLAPHHYRISWATHHLVGQQVAMHDSLCFRLPTGEYIGTFWRPAERSGQERHVVLLSDDRKSRFWKRLDDEYPAGDFWAVYDKLDLTVPTAYSSSTNSATEFFNPPFELNPVPSKDDLQFIRDVLRIFYRMRAEESANAREPYNPEGEAEDDGYRLTAEDAKHDHDEAMSQQSETPGWAEPYDDGLDDLPKPTKPKRNWYDPQ